MSYTIRFYENAGHSPAWPLVTYAEVELEAAGLSFQPYVSPFWNDTAMVAIGEDGNAQGFLIYRYDEVKCSWFILLAYVAVTHRRQGIHTALFEALVARAKKRDDILTIECGTHVANAAAQAAFEAQGRTKAALMYTYRLKDWDNGKHPTDIPSA